ncbi:putative reverse transcriptase domain-containing protein [Tanacetum coccineum]
MTRSTVKRLTKPLEEPEREFRRLRRAALRSHQNESLAIVGRNLFNDEASSSNNTGPKPSTPPKTLLRFFHFSLKGKAAEWLDRIPPTQVMTWDQLVSRFLDHFFPVGRTSALRDLILRFKQGDEKPIKSAWICFQDLIKQVPHHGIKKWLLVQIFYDNISQDDRRKLDQFAQFRFHSLIEEERWIQIEEYVQYQDDLWDDMSPPMNISSI